MSTALCSSSFKSRVPFLGQTINPFLWKKCMYREFLKLHFASVNDTLICALQSGPNCKIAKAGLFLITEVKLKIFVHSGDRSKLY